MSEEKYNIPIKELNFSVRSFNVLMRNGIDTVDKLAERFDIYREIVDSKMRRKLRER